MQNQKQLMTVAEPNVLLKLPGIEKVYVLYFFFSQQGPHKEMQWTFITAIAKINYIMEK